MQKIFLLILISSLTVSLTAQNHSSETETQFKSLQWLQGNWERTNMKAGSSAIEKWHSSGPNELKGLGITMRGSDTVFLEKISVVIKDNNIYYVADVKENKEPVYFKVTSINPNGFVCENPAHDFPKKIEYKLTAPSLKVIISGGDKAQSFSFTRR